MRQRITKIIVIIVRCLLLFAIIRFFGFFQWKIHIRLNRINSRFDKNHNNRSSLFNNNIRTIWFSMLIVKTMKIYKTFNSMEPKKGIKCVDYNNRIIEWIWWIKFYNRLTFEASLMDAPDSCIHHTSVTSRVSCAFQFVVLSRAQ